MTTKLVKQGTSLQEVSSEELSKLSERAGFQPSTPMGAQLIGANPDQAKMVKQQAKDPFRINNELDKEERLSETPIERSSAEDKLNRLKNLGTLGAQVQGLIAGYEQNLLSQQAALQINEAAMQTTPLSQRAGLRQALDEFKGATTKDGKEAAVLKAGNLLGRAITGEELASYYNAAPDQIASLGKAVTPDQVQIADLDVASAGIDLATLADDLGVPEDTLSTYTLPQLKSAIEDLQQREFSSDMNLEAEALAAVGNRAKQLQDERRAMAAQGGRATDADFERLANAIAKVDIVNFGGKQYDIGSLLRDEDISKVLMDAAMSDQSFQQLAQTEPELARWVASYRDVLQDLSDEAQREAEEVKVRQAEFQKLGAGLSKNLYNALFGAQEGLVSSTQLAALQEKQANSPIWKLLTGDYPQKRTLLTRLELDPSRAEDLKDKSEAEIMSLVDFSKLADGNTALQDYLGYMPGGLLTDEQLAEAKDKAEVFRSLPPSITADKKFQDYLRDGTISKAATRFLQGDEGLDLWRQLREEEAAQRRAANIKSPEELLAYFMGDGYSLTKFNEDLDNLRAWAATGDQTAVEYYRKLREGLVGPDGKFDSGDLDRALELMRNASKTADSFILSGGQGLNKFSTNTRSLMAPAVGYWDNRAPTAKMIAIDYLKDDGRISPEEFRRMFKANDHNPEMVKEILNSNWLPPEDKEALTKQYNTLYQDYRRELELPMFEQFKRIPYITSTSDTDSRGNHRLMFRYDVRKLDPAKNGAELDMPRNELKRLLADSQKLDRGTLDGAESENTKSLKERLEYTEWLKAFYMLNHSSDGRHLTADDIRSTLNKVAWFDVWDPANKELTAEQITDKWNKGLEEFRNKSEAERKEAEAAAGKTLLPGIRGNGVPISGGISKNADYVWEAEPDVDFIKSILGTPGMPDPRTLSDKQKVALHGAKVGMLGEVTKRLEQAKANPDKSKEEQKASEIYNSYPKVFLDSPEAKAININDFIKPNPNFDAHDVMTDQDISRMVAISLLDGGKPWTKGNDRPYMLDEEALKRALQDAQAKVFSRSMNQGSSSAPKSSGKAAKKPPGGRYVER